MGAVGGERGEAEYPSFDDEWIAAAHIREASVAELEAERQAELRTQQRVQRRALLRTTIGAFVLLACLAGFAWYVVTSNARDGESGIPLAGDSGNVQRDTFAADDRPTPSSGSGRRLRPEIAADDPTAAHAFIATRSDGSPVRYDPCRPVRFVVNPEHAPPEYLPLIGETLATASAATGLQLELVGATTEPPTSARDPFQRDRYGDQWAPILIAWTDETVIPELAGGVGGIGGSTWSDVGPDAGWFVSGMLFLDIDLGADPERNRIGMLHELGHVLGLAHVDDPNQLMYHSAETGEPGQGDLAGFAAVGAGECAGEL